MSIRIRLARHGVRNNPLYHIVAIKSTRAREGRPLEKLGEYDPIPKIPHTDAIPPANRIFGKERVPQPIAKRVEWDVSRLTWWLDNGAQPSTPVVKLMQKAGLLEGKYSWERPRHDPSNEQASADPSTDSSKPPSRERRTAGTGPVLSQVGETTGFDGKTAT